MKNSCLEEAEISWDAWKRCRPAESLWSDTLQLLSCLQAVQYAPGLQLLWAVSHSEVGLGNAAICESFLCTSNRTHWLTKLDFDGGILWYIMNLDEFGMSWAPYLGWVDVHVCSVPPGGKKCSHNNMKGFGGRKRKLESDDIIFSIFKSEIRKLMKSFFVEDFRYKESKARETAHRRTRRIPNWQWGLKGGRTVSFSNSHYHGPVQWKWKTFQIGRNQTKVAKGDTIQVRVCFNSADPRHSCIIFSVDVKRCQTLVYPLINIFMNTSSNIFAVFKFLFPMMKAGHLHHLD